MTKSSGLVAAFGGGVFVIRMGIVEGIVKRSFPHLMTAMVAPRSPDERHVFSYDDAGRLIRDESPTGFYQTLSRKVSDDGVEVTRTERDVRKYTYALQRRGDDKIVRRQVNAAGVAMTIETGAVTFVQAPTQSTTTTVEADPRFDLDVVITVNLPFTIQWTADGATEEFLMREIIVAELRRLARDAERRATYWVLLGVLAMPLFYWFGKPTFVEAMRRVFMACGFHLIDFGWSLGVIKKSIPKHNRTKTQRYTGRAAVAWGLVQFICGIGLVLCGILTSV